MNHLIKLGNVRLPTPRKLETIDQNLNQIENDEILPLTVQTTLVNGQMTKINDRFSIYYSHDLSLQKDNQVFVLPD